ncbi:hypothetical protein [Azohydromonas lata]|uniref:hypothetical protein n=1 Tax=Azohydromonas lata TaxID=45677 RepID=UPI0012F4DBE4|nr:hypothetical protein [Azohydromonas lata]
MRINQRVVVRKVLQTQLLEDGGGLAVNLFDNDGGKALTHDVLSVRLLLNGKSKALADLRPVCQSKASDLCWATA